MNVGRFDDCLKSVLSEEGGYVNDPRDPGGATNKGITQCVYDAYRKKNKNRTQSVKLISDEEVSHIYLEQYWRPVAGDQLPVGVDLSIFDFAVNSGPVTAAKFLQAAVGVPIDGHIGNVTLNALEGRDRPTIITDIANRRIRYLKSLSGWKYFGKGWQNRVLRVQDRSLSEYPRYAYHDDNHNVSRETNDMSSAGIKAKPDEGGDKTDRIVAIATGSSGVVATILSAVQSPWGVAALGILLAFAGLLIYKILNSKKMPGLL